MAAAARPLGYRRRSPDTIAGLIAVTLAAGAALALLDAVVQQLAPGGAAYGTLRRSLLGDSAAAPPPAPLQYSTGQKARATLSCARVPRAAGTAHAPLPRPRCSRAALSRQRARARARAPAALRVRAPLFARARSRPVVASPVA